MNSIMRFFKAIKKLPGMKTPITILDLFISEYLANHIVNHIPNERIRYLFYKYVLLINVDSSVYFQMGIYMYAHRNDFKIGANTIINRNSVLDRRGGLIIGKNVNISPSVEIYTMGHDINSPYFHEKSGKVIIGDYVWVGTRAMIMPGVTIGKGAMIMPGAIVTNNVKPYEIVGGVPAKHIGIRSKDLRYEFNWRWYFG